MALTLRVINNASERLCVGSVPARIGMVTDSGPITRMTEKSIWVQCRDGVERLFRGSDHVPPVRQRNAGKEFKPS